MDNELSNKYKDYTRRELLEQGFLCGTIDGFRYHVSELEDPCPYCQIFIDKYKEEQDRVNNSKTSLIDWRKANPELAKMFIVPPGSSETISKKIRTKEYRAANPEKFAQYSRTRRAKKRGVQSEPYELKDIPKRHGRDCYLCLELIDYEANRTMGQEGWESGLHLDHIIPISLGGGNTVANVGLTHGFYNASKGDKTVEELDCLETRKARYLEAINIRIRL